MRSIRAGYIDDAASQLCIPWSSATAAPIQRPVAQSSLAAATVKRNTEAEGRSSRSFFRVQSVTVQNAHESVISCACSKPCSTSAATHDKWAPIVRKAGVYAD